ncbi:hypothetical protein DTO169C6_6349 [Paecilomyces variotii]|nr:hypothetical protein DTO169C6_6349 [Paecilomyces variotii]
MAQPTVPGVVHKGDLILVYKPKKAHMLLVKSAPNHTDNANAIPNAASITVQKVNWHIPGSPGFWTLSGPEVYYIDKAEKVVEDEELHNSNFIYSWYCFYEDHSTDLEEDNLEEFLKTMVSANADANDDSSDVSLIVNPHGRDVIKHYFKGSCPNCGTLAVRPTSRAQFA